MIADSSVPLLFQMSYMYYTVVGTLIGVSIGMIVSMVTDPPDLANMDRRLISPYMHRFLPEPPIIFMEELKLVEPVELEPVVEMVFEVVENEDMVEEEPIPCKRDIDLPE